MKASSNDGDESEGDDTLTDVTFIGEGMPVDQIMSTISKKLRVLEATIILEAQIIDEYEWDEKAMLNIIVVEVDLENDGDEGMTNWSTTSSAPASPPIK